MPPAPPAVDAASASAATNPMISAPGVAGAAAAMELETPSIPKCDQQDSHKPNMVTDYVEDLYKYYKNQERERSPTMYMQNQTDINARMRAILIDWLVEVHLKFKLVPSTLYLCVTLIDQYCTVNQVARSKLQLVGVTALFIACKYEEIYPPEVKDCVYITDHAYTREEVLEMEMKMLRFFEYNISVPTCYQFLVRFLRIAGYNTSSRVAYRASYFSERCLQEHEMLSYKPSLIAASVVYLATSMEKATPWNRQLREYAGFTLDQILPCARQISEHVNKNPITASKRPLHAVRKKFESPKFMEIAEEHPPVL
jgi:cyclin B